jgi:hypothetical protein
MYTHKNYFIVLERIELILSVSGRFRKVSEGRQTRAIEIPPLRQPSIPADLVCAPATTPVASNRFAKRRPTRKSNARDRSCDRVRPREAEHPTCSEPPRIASINLEAPAHGSLSNLILAIDAPTGPAARQLRSWFLLQGNNCGEHDD